jgi:AcrR family transcriptional regulator
MIVAEKPSPEREPRWERRPDERPREILDAALRVFAEKGYRCARLEQVAEAAGVTKGTVYHYFAGKEDVLRQAVAQAHERLFGRLEEMLRRDGGSAESRIRLLVRAAFTPGDQPSESVLALLVQGLAH